MNIAICGYGTVAQALFKKLQSSEFKVLKLLRRPGKEEGALMTSVFSDIVEDERIECVVELMGGLHPAYEYCMEALQKGKHVVTANKALLNAYGDELNACARKHQRALLFSAACGGGIPILPTILELKSESIQSIQGILNGTTNYILDAMERTGLSFDEALSQAQKLGYAEADSSSDLEGWDSLYKIRLAAALSQDVWVKPDSILRFGIETLHLEDIETIKDLGYKLRLIASMTVKDTSISMMVEPCCVTKDQFEASLLENTNGVTIQTLNQTKVLTGLGAGGEPTAQNVYNDLIRIQQGTRSFFPENLTSIASVNNEKTSYLIRLPKETSFPHLSWFKESWESESFRYGITHDLQCSTVHRTLSEWKKHEACFMARLKEKRV